MFIATAVLLTVSPPLDRTTIKIAAPPVSKVCAIPLKEIHATRHNFDPIAVPAKSTSFDKIAHPPPIPACATY